MDNSAFDPIQEERKKSFKPSSLPSPILERERYAVLLRKNHKNTTIEKKRLTIMSAEFLTPEAAMEENNAVMSFLGNTPGFIDKSTV